jgi:glycosyltransferase 2 family protein
VWGGLAISALFAYLAVRHVHFREVWHALEASNYWWLVPALGALAVATVMRVFRWQFLFARETRPPFRPVLSAMLIGLFVNNVLPARAGEAARVVALNQSTGASRAEIAGTVVVERAYDVFSVLVLLFVLVPWLPHVSWLRAAAILAIVLSVGLAVAAIVLFRYRERPIRFVLRPLSRLPFLSLDRTEQAAANLAHGFAGLRRPRLALAALVLTISSWFVVGISAWLLMKGFDLHLSVVAGTLVMIAVALAMILPSSPAAVGVFEAATLVALHAYHVPSSKGLSYALVLHALNFLPFIAAGVFFLQTHALSLRARARS